MLSLWTTLEVDFRPSVIEGILSATAWFTFPSMRAFHSRSLPAIVPLFSAPHHSPEMRLPLPAILGMPHTHIHRRRAPPLLSADDDTLHAILQRERPMGPCFARGKDQVDHGVASCERTTSWRAISGRGPDIVYGEARTMPCSSSLRSTHCPNCIVQEQYTTAQAAFAIHPGRCGCKITRAPRRFLFHQLNCCVLTCL